MVWSWALQQDADFLLGWFWRSGAAPLKEGIWLFSVDTVPMCTVSGLSFEGLLLFNSVGAAGFCTSHKAPKFWLDLHWEKNWFLCLLASQSSEVKPDVSVAPGESEPVRRMQEARAALRMGAGGRSWTLGKLVAKGTCLRPDPADSVVVGKKRHLVLLGAQGSLGHW